MRLALGIDGGGTKTDCVLMEESGRILGRGRGGPSNPHRIGFRDAERGILEAAKLAAGEAGVKLKDVTEVCAGLAGVGRAENAAEIKKLLRESFPVARLEVCTDLELALAAIGTGPAIVLVAGTGSAGIGRNGNGETARTGGFGPTGSDEGSAFDVGKQTVEIVFGESAGQHGDLRIQILRQLGCESFEEISAKVRKNRDEVYPRIFPVVAAAADAGNEVTRSLLQGAAEKLAGLVDQLQAILGLRGSEFTLGKTGGMIGRSAFFDAVLDAELNRVAPGARLRVNTTPPAEIAARRALAS